MQLSFAPSFKERLRGRFEKYTFEVGILEDEAHKAPKVGKSGLKGEDVKGTYAGGPVRKKSNKDSGVTIAEVSAANRKRLGFNYLTAPFQKKNDDIIKFTNEFFKFAFGRSQKKRLENLLQAIVRNPILRGDYGSNGALTKRIKGFDRNMIDTAQLFKAIKALCKVRGG